MRSVSGTVRFVQSYPLASFGHVQNFERTPPDKDVRFYERFLSVSMRFVQFSCVRHPVGILYVSVVVERSILGHVTVKTDEYRMLNGQETHITDAKRWFMRSISMEQDSTPSPPLLQHH